jgi:hypothetical protein
MEKRIKTPIGDLLEEHHDFMLGSQHRLVDGDEEYGGATEHKPMSALLYDVMEEIYDITNYNFMLYRRIKSLARKVHRLESSIEEASDPLMFDVDAYGNYFVSDE